MRTRTISAALVLGAGLVLVTGLPASAHVTVSMPVPPDDGSGTLWFQVPSEKDAARTVKLTVHLPTARPLAFVSAKPMDGWKVTTTTKRFDKPVTTGGFTLTKAISSVTWTATGAGLAPGEFTQFLISAGPLPDSGSVRFPTTQTYDDGTVVEWRQLQKKGAGEPDHPAPTIEIPATEAVNGGDANMTRSNVALGLGGAGLLAGLVGLGVAVRRPA